MKWARLGIAMAVILTIAGNAQGTVHVITVANFSFTPKNLTVAVGDTARWRWSSGSHTTTNGTGPTDPNSGKLWNAPINSSQQTFQRQFNDAGVFSYYCIPHESLGMTGSITVQVSTGVLDGSDGAPVQFFLTQNHPNPFNASTAISYGLATGGHTTITVYNLLGQTVAIVLDQDETPGPHTAIWDGKDIHGNAAPSGMYFYRLSSSTFTEMRKMVLVK